jgi:hypothetical protein
VLVNNRRISKKQTELYAADGAFQIGIEDDLTTDLFDGGTELVRADLLEEGEMVRHNSERLARVVVACAEKGRAVNVPTMV